jgi:uncharacterized protein (TIGR02598 family)
LIEVVLAIGILCFAMLPMVALMPTGLSRLGESSSRTVRTEIVRSVATYVRQVSFSNLPAAGTNWYYDQEGQFMAGSPPAGDWLYRVNWRPVACPLPDGTSAGFNCHPLRQVEIVFTTKNSAAQTISRILVCRMDGSTN